jgi:hypothetical protein
MVNSSYMDYLKHYLNGILALGCLDMCTDIIIVHKGGNEHKERDTLIKQFNAKNVRAFSSSQKISTYDINPLQPKKGGYTPDPDGPRAMSWKKLEERFNKTITHHHSRR